MTISFISSSKPEGPGELTWNELQVNAAKHGDGCLACAPTVPGPSGGLASGRMILRPPPA